MTIKQGHINGQRLFFFGFFCSDDITRLWRNMFLFDIKSHKKARRESNVVSFGALLFVIGTTKNSDLEFSAEKN